MSEFEIVAEGRTDLGKASTRRLRRLGKIPAVLYGGEKEPASLTLSLKDLRKQLENEAFYSHLLTVKTPQGSEQVVLKALQRHPATSEVAHVDFLRTSATQVLHMRVPLHFINEETSPGKKAGGVVSHTMNEVDITCLPRDLPEYIEVNMEALDLGDSVHLSDLVVPKGVELTALAHGEDSVDSMVVSLHLPRVEAEEDVAEDGEADEPAATEE
jgi:large subunit ribosomal protein L25